MTLELCGSLLGTLTRFVCWAAPKPRLRHPKASHSPPQVRLYLEAKALEHLECLLGCLIYSLNFNVQERRGCTAARLSSSRAATLQFAKGVLTLVYSADTIYAERHVIELFSKRPTKWCVGGTNKVLGPGACGGLRGRPLAASTCRLLGYTPLGDTCPDYSKGSQPAVAAPGLRLEHARSDMFATLQ